MNVLTQRIISAMIIVPLVIAMLFLLPFTAFWVISWLLMALAAWEWLPLAGYTTISTRLLGVLLIIGLGMTISLAGIFDEQRTVLWFALLFWLLLTPLVLTFPATQSVWGESRITRFILGLLVIIPCGCALTLAADKAWRFYLLFGLLLIWGADIGAYFAGHRWGAAKMHPSVSPGKTIAGLVGAIVTGIAISLIFWLILSAEWLEVMQFLVIGVITVLASVMGDLMESMMKRNAGIKDSGNLIPGHGGILDRLDSMLAALPVFMLLSAI